MEIKAYLSKHKITGGDFAKRLGVSRARLSNVVTGRRDPSFRLMLDIIRLSDGEITSDGVIAPFLRRRELAIDPTPRKGADENTSYGRNDPDETTVNQ